MQLCEICMAPEPPRGLEDVGVVRRTKGDQRGDGSFLRMRDKWCAECCGALKANGWGALLDRYKTATEVAR